MSTTAESIKQGAQFPFAFATHRLSIASWEVCPRICGMRHARMMPDVCEREHMQGYQGLELEHAPKKVNPS